MRIIAKRLAHLSDAVRHRGLGHNCTRPNIIKQLIFRYQMPMSLDQIQQRLKGLGSEIDFLITPPQTMLTQFQREIGKAIDLRSPFMCSHHLIN